MRGDVRLEKSGALVVDVNVTPASYTGKTLAGFPILLDEKSCPPVDVTEEPNKPGNYLLNFTPPDQCRDGKDLRIEVNLKGAGSITTTVKLPKPPRGGGEGKCVATI